MNAERDQEISDARRQLVDLIAEFLSRMAKVDNPGRTEWPPGRKESKVRRMLRGGGTSDQVMRVWDLSYGQGDGIGHLLLTTDGQARAFSRANRDSRWVDFRSEDPGLIGVGSSSAKRDEVNLKSLADSMAAMLRKNGAA